MASSIINSDDGVISGTSGLKSSGGDDGVLVFQSKGTETARINTDSQIVAAAGTASLPIYSTTGDLNTGIYFPAADNIGFTTGGTIRGRWTTDGLCFNADTAAANALDDYEEGTWTPATSSAGYTISASSGAYTKIGRQVFLRFQVSFSAVGAGNSSFQLTTAPFAAASVGAGFVGTGRDCTSTGAIYVVQLPAGSATFNINSYSGISSGSARTFTTGEDYVFSLYYYV